MNIQTKCGDVVDKILNVVIEAEGPFKYRWSYHERTSGLLNPHIREIIIVLANHFICVKCTFLGFGWLVLLLVLYTELGLKIDST